jgi:hypothetical protein
MRQRIKSAQETPDAFLAKIWSEAFIGFQTLGFKPETRMRFPQFPLSFDGDVYAWPSFAQLGSAAGFFLIINGVTIYPSRSIGRHFNETFDGLFEFSRDVFLM